MHNNVIKTETQRATNIESKLSLSKSSLEKRKDVWWLVEE